MNRAGFTLLELMVVVLIVGTIAGFAIPSYQKTVERGHKREAEAQLSLIHGAQEIYRARYGTYWDGGGGTLTDINSDMPAGLGLNIVPIDFDYSCTQTLPTNYSCSADKNTGDNFTLTMTQAAFVRNVNPSCSGSCP